MFVGYDFVYDGKSSMSENLKLLYTDAKAFSEVNSIPNTKYSMFKTTRSSRWTMTGVDYEEPYKFEIEIMLHRDEEEYKKRNPILKRNFVSKIRRWLFNSTRFKKFQILSDEMKDLYFMAILTEPQDILSGGEIIGFKATVMCDCSGAYEYKKFTKTCNGTTTLSFQCLQDSIYEIRPKYKFVLNSTDITMDVNGTVMELKSLTEGSTVIIDTETLITQSSVEDNLYAEGRFNKVFPTLSYGKNTITIIGRCEFTVEFDLIREVGG